MAKTKELAAGDKAPDFKMPGAKGKTVVLYFYPKDDTSGCTKEACGFRDARILHRTRDEHITFDRHGDAE